MLGRHKFVPISWISTKQTSVSHSSTESEIISLDAGLRMDCIPVLDLWDLVIEVVFFVQPNWEIQRQCAGKPAGWHTIKKTYQEPRKDSNSVQRSWIMQRRLCCHKRGVLSIWYDAFHFWRDRYPQPSSTIHTWSTYGRDWPSVLVAFAFDLMTKQYKGSKPDLLVELVWCCCTVCHITAWRSGHDSDILLTHRRLIPKSDHEKTTLIIHSAQRTCTRFASFPTLAQIQFEDLELCNVDCVASNVESSQSGTMLSIFEDNEAVIKMIINGRTPTMRHVSQTHSVALDWPFDRIILDPKIRIRYVDSKNQLADILTKGNFTRDEWNHLLHLFNISNFSSASYPEAMSKRMQEGELWQRRSRRWTWSRVLRQAILQSRVRVHPIAQGYSEHPVSKVRIS